MTFGMFPFLNNKQIRFILRMYTEQFFHIFLYFNVAGVNYKSYQLVMVLVNE